MSDTCLYWLLGAAALALLPALGSGGGGGVLRGRGDREPDLRNVRISRSGFLFRKGDP